MRTVDPHMAIKGPAIKRPLTTLPDPASGEQEPPRSPGFGLTWRAVLGLAAGLALGLFLLPVAARGVSLEQVRSRLSLARPGWVTLAALAVLLTTAAKAVRWRALVDAEARPSLWHLGQALLVGKSLNALLPARIGDLARIYLAASRTPISRAAILGTLAAEKAFDALFFLISGGLALLLVPLPPWLNAPMIGGTSAGILLVVLALAWPQNQIVTWLGRWARRLPWGLGEWLGGFFQRVFSGLASLRDPRLAGVAGVWSALIWALAAATNALLFCAFDLDLGAGAALLLLVVLYAGVAPPSSPGRLGVFHALTVLTLEALGIDRALGLAYATLLHAIVYLPEILPGAILLGLRLAAVGAHLRPQTPKQASQPQSQGKETAP